MRRCLGRAKAWKLIRASLERQARHGARSPTFIVIRDGVAVEYDDGWEIQISRRKATDGKPAVKAGRAARSGHVEETRDRS